MEQRDFVSVPKGAHLLSRQQISTPKSAAPSGLHTSCNLSCYCHRRSRAEWVGLLLTVYQRCGSHPFLKPTFWLQWDRPNLFSKTPRSS